jgi:hypothetical protein
VVFGPRVHIIHIDPWRGSAGQQALLQNAPKSAKRARGGGGERNFSPPTSVWCSKALNDPQRSGGPSPADAVGKTWPRAESLKWFADPLTESGGRLDLELAEILF